MFRNQILSTVAACVTVCAAAIVAVFGAGPARADSICSCYTYAVLEKHCAKGVQVTYVKTTQVSKSAGTTDTTTTIQCGAAQFVSREVKTGDEGKGACSRQSAEPVARDSLDGDEAWSCKDELREYGGADGLDLYANKKCTTSTSGQGSDVVVSTESCTMSGE